MSESNQAADKPEDDPVDALAELATSAEQPVARPDEGDGQSDASTALSKMDEGQELDVARLLSGENAQPAGEDGILELADDDEHAPAWGAGPAAGAGGPALRSVPRAAGRTHTHMYKKTMIPLLLTGGALLVLIGLISAGMVLAGWAPEKATALALIAGVSFPLAGILFFGAWWFGRDVQRAGG